MSKAAIWGPVLKGTNLGQYTVGDPIGEGNFCVVLEGQGTSPKGQVALKVLEPSAQVEDQVDFKNEGVLLHKLRKARAIVDIVETRVDTIQLQSPVGVPVPMSLHTHVLEYGDGMLEELVESDVVRQDWDWAERLTHWRACILGIHEMHLKRVVHRDLKSSNCLLFLKNKDVPCKVSDLGRARDLDKLAHLPAQDYIAGRGDLRFAPPELLWLRGTPDDEDAHRAADLYALGSLLFELGTGQGITAAALPTPHDVVQIALADRQAGIRRDLGALRPRYEIPLAQFHHACPPAIRHETTNLIRQLCDPDPSARGMKVGSRRPIRGEGLNWLLRKADILQKRLKHNAARPHKKSSAA
ncbi:protein kinase domain-containing protein [Jiangella gansuensis]|uniref:protein kinase domain-containing protein n=1 Tax=Jiangella gansuensis TaxID=281473 RepID=UPI0004AE8D05|nr:protein kinase [Jiangella gansuensis]